MMPWFPFGFDVARFGAANGAAAVQAAVTIGQRLPAFAAVASATGTAATAAEAAEVQRAVAEKAAAAMDGAFAAGLAWQRLWFDAALGRLRPEALPGRLMAIGEAAAAPARRKVAANARRLTRRR